MGEQESVLLGPGARGPDVARVQQRLRELGYELAVDGVFGPETEDAVYFFKHRNGVAADGELRAPDLSLLFSAEAQPAGADVKASDPVGAAEVRAMLELLKPAFDATDEATRRRYVTEALLAFGMRSLMMVHRVEEEAEGELKESAGELSRLGQDVLLEWLAGNALSERSDEDELRALVALDVLAAGGTGIVRLAAGAVLRLPAGHPLRDVEQLRTGLLGRLGETRENGEWSDYALLAETLLDDELLDEAAAASLADEMVAVASNAAIPAEALENADRRRLLVAVAGWHMVASVALRESDAGRSAAHRAASAEVLAQAQAIASDPRDVLIQAVNLDDSGRSQEAAELLAPLAETDTEVGRTAAWIEGMIRLRLGEYARAAAVLERVVPQEAEHYVLATAAEEIAEAGERYGKDAANLAFSYACLGEWGKSLETLDRAKSPRMRHAEQLRQSTAGKELLALEARLASAARGVPDTGAAPDRHADPLGARVSATVRALEAYRKARPDLGTAHLAPPDIAQVARALAADEAVVCLGSNFKGLLIAIILPGDTAEPSGRFILEELTGERVVDLMMTDEEVSGWALEMAAVEPIDPEPALQSYITKCDAAFGTLLARFLAEHHVRRVTIIPHRLLHFVPFWALPGLRPFDVRTARSLAQWYALHDRVVPLGTRACIVGNPTLDLPFSAAEAELVSALLAARGCQPELLLETDAREPAIRASLRESGLLHFAGHGLARATQPMGSGLLTNPDEKWRWPAGGDPLEAAATQVSEWREASTGERYADVPAGRLLEFTDDAGELVERQLEHSASGTLWGCYAGGKLLRLSELWTASDMMTEDALASCGLAFLVACQSGQPPFNAEYDEDLSLPGALQLAGVDAVVCTLWPVNDVVALVFSTIFYRELDSRAPGEVDLAALVRACRAALADMHRDAALATLRLTHEHTTRADAREYLELAMGILSDGPEQPFAHPYYWAPFFTQGAARVTLSW